jgi:hypothetical protein
MLACLIAQAAGLSQFLRNPTGVPFGSVPPPKRTYTRYPINVSCKSRAFIHFTPFFRFVHFKHLKKSFLRSSKTPPSPCVVKQHRSPTFPSGSLFGLPPSLNSRTARAFRSPFVRSSLRFLSMLPHSGKASP